MEDKDLQVSEASGQDPEIVKENNGFGEEKHPQMGWAEVFSSDAQQDSDTQKIVEAEVPFIPAVLETSQADHIGAPQMVVPIHNSEEAGVTEPLITEAGTESVIEELPLAAAGAANFVEEPSARERLRGSVLEEQKTSDFMRPGSLFEGYEITNTKQIPFFMRVFAASALAHLVIFASALQLPAVVQTSCESTEFTQQLCDTMYIASLVSSTSVVAEPYDQTVIPDALNGEEITMISTSDFTYPEGYWTLRDELEGRTPTDMIIDPATGTVTDGSMTGTVNGGGFNPPLSTVNTPGPTLDLGRKPNLPKNSGKITGGVDDLEMGSGGGTSSTPTQTGPLGNNGGGVKLGGGKRPTNNGTGKTGTGTGNQQSLGNKINNQGTGSTPGTTDPNKFNKQPLLDFRNRVVEWRDAQKNDLFQRFDYAFAAKIKEGKLEIDEKSLLFNGDSKMQEMVKAGVAAFSDSRILRVLEKMESQQVKITFAQDGSQFLVGLESLQPTDIKARTLSSTLNVVLEAGKILNSRNADDKETLELLNMAQIGADGSKLTITVPVSNQFVEAFYQKYKQDLLKNPQGNNQGVASTPNKQATIK